MNNDVRELQDSARQVLAGLGLAADEAASWPRIADLGWLMISTTEEMGGLGMGLAGACALQLELGRQLATVPFLPAVLAIEALAHGVLADKVQWLERLTAGEMYVAVPLADCALTVQRDSRGVLLLTGTLLAVPSADNASHVLLSTLNGEHVGLVATDQPGVTVIERATWDTTRRLFDLQFDAVELEEHHIVASGSQAQALAMRLAVQRDFLLAADAVGGAAALLQMTVDYLQARTQFGRPLALFQALKHRCADLKAQTEAAEALLLDSLGRQQMDSADGIACAELAGKAAKQLACTAFATVAEEALQLHGGIGMTSEHNCHLFLKRALLNEHLGRAPDSYETGIADAFLASCQPTCASIQTL
ncbi:MAG: acyl-CoA dehydrogenase family protein [Haliea sp.]|nr:acyl-CoA dehydrogenase family protein [Haliea sp.]